MFEAIGRSLRSKVMLLVLATTGSALALSALALVFYDLRLYERQATADLTTQAELLGRASAPALSFADRRTAEQDLSVLQVRPRIFAAALYDRAGALFASYIRPGLQGQGFPESARAEGYRIEGGQVEVFRQVIENGESVGSVYLRAEYNPWSRLLDYLSIIAGVMVASLAAAALISSRLQKAVTTPILEVARVSHDVVQKRDYGLRVRKTTRDEVGELVDAFNAMLAEVGRSTHELREADRRKDEFLAILAHELRNPLAPLRNALEILRLSGDDPVRAEKARQMMARQLGQMVRLVDDLLDVSRITTGKLGVRPATIDLRDPLRDAVETVRPFIDQRGHHLEVALPGEAVSVEGDRTRLAQVVANLLNNAAKYTPPRGHIRLALEPGDRETVITVSDDGIGLTGESMARIFDMFVQVDHSLDRSQAGLGVGLTLARRLVELHAGTIGVASPGPGRGTTFTVRLPASYRRLGHDVVAQPSDASTPRGRRIVLADDNTDFADSLGELLAAQGHEVRVAHDGEQALALLGSFRPDVAFLDIGMPKVHGYEVARRARAAGLTCRLVAVTGWGQDNDRQRAREAGFDRHLVKPVEPEQIQAILGAL